MLLLVLADNLLMMFFGWEGVGLCSYALIGHFYRDEPKHWVGSPGDKALGVSEEYSPTKAGMKAFVMTRIGDIANAFIRSEEHTSELQSPYDLVCRLLLEKKNIRSSCLQFTFVAVRRVSNRVLE